MFREISEAWLRQRQKAAQANREYYSYWLQRLGGSNATVGVGRQVQHVQLPVC